MEAYSFSDFCRMAAGTPAGNDHGQALVKELLTDSRRLIHPMSTLFIALKTTKNDGHRFIPELFEKGVCLFMVSSLPVNYQKRFPNAAFILVDNTLHALQTMASFHRQRFELPVLAVTGSNGKTIVKEWLFQLLMDRRNIVRNPKSYNSQIGVPLSVMQIEAAHELGVFEAGISCPGEMEKLREIIHPDIGIFTNIGTAHDEGFSSTQEKIAEKLKLFTSCRGLIYCSDHYLLAAEIARWKVANPSVKLFAWSFLPGAQMQVLSQVREENHTLIRLLLQGQTLAFTIPFADKASVENALHCLAFLFFTGFSNGWIQERMKLLQPVAMRMEMKEGINHSLIINDTYNSDLNSLGIALDFLDAQNGHKKRTLILSDILQSGMQIPELYAEVAAMITARKIHRFIGIGPDISSQQHLFAPHSEFFDDSQAFIKDFDFLRLQQEAILLKGARVFGFEKISTLLQQKDHQTILEINLDSLVHNLNVFRSLLKSPVKVMAMVKAFSYGSGGVQIASMLQYHQVDCLAVAYADEGKDLRQGGIHLPIIVMNPEVRSFDTLFKYKLQPEIYSLSLLRRLAVAAREYPGISKDNPLAVHLKLDTGMHRLGFLPHETNEMVGILLNNPHLKVHSCFSHFAASGDAGHDDFSRGQIDLFTQWCQTLEKSIGNFQRHICNTSAISRFPEAHFDMVRPGVGLYGVSNDAAIQDLLQAVSTFRSVVSQVKPVVLGDTIGYSRAALAHSDMEIAIVPVGYADGLNRRLGNGVGKLSINGHLVDIVGNISMDMCAVDVTGLGVKEGDEVIIFGKEHGVQQMADALQTIPYEIFTSVSQRVKRIYFHE